MKQSQQSRGIRVPNSGPEFSNFQKSKLFEEGSQVRSNKVHKCHRGVFCFLPGSQVTPMSVVKLYSRLFSFSFLSTASCATPNIPQKWNESQRVLSEEQKNISVNNVTAKTKNWCLKNRSTFLCIMWKPWITAWKNQYSRTKWEKKLKLKFDDQHKKGKIVQKYVMVEV